MNDFERKLETYADIAVSVGVNIQKGQTLVINASISASDFVRKVCRSAYKQGAHYVYVHWIDEELTRIEYELMSEEALQNIQPWLVRGFEKMADNGAAFLYIISPHSNNVSGIDPKRLDLAEHAASQAFQSFNNRLMSMKVSWTVMAVATKKWAKLIFPNVDSEQAIHQLWEAIFQATKINEANPKLAWNNHIATLTEKAAWLNTLHFRYLHFTTPQSNLTIELPENHVWANALATNLNGNTFISNLPTEEVYTTPLKNGVNGIIKGTKPFYYDGQLIRDFSLTFKEGEIVSFSAKEGYEVLERILNTDEGAKYIGEVAIVPHHSSISTSNLLYYHPLFDENASCHIAIGHAYTTGLKDGQFIQPEQYDEQGINSSFIHFDLMIGSEHLQINGECMDGTLVPVIKKGNWVTDFDE
ncbi:aminopeptidase [Bacillus massiliigorillae]|uniref:aminopeptidase n=1 Tax=Bacillus massiliigorillae TaxID=1243664 RepID=UPI0003A6D876|nr:aminopeptidase [Bacillus massiliigorillae]